MIFLKPVFAHAPCSHRLCPILVSILSLLETICVAFFAIYFFFCTFCSHWVYVCMQSSLSLYLLFLEPLFGYIHTAKTRNKCILLFIPFAFEFFSFSEFAFRFFFLLSCYYLLCECKDVVFSQDALEILCRYLCCFCTSSKFHVHDIFCISCVPVEQQTKTEQKHKLTTSEKFCFLFYIPSPAIPLSRSLSLFLMFAPFA